MKKIFILTVAIMIATISKAQIVTFDEVETIELHNFQAIQIKNEVQGYLVFYKKDKLSKSENMYELAILDNNLKRTNSMELVKEKDILLLQSAFNGDHLYLEFLNQKDKKIEIEIYDKSLVKTGMYQIDLSKKDLESFGYAPQNSSPMTEMVGIKPLTPIPNKSFLRFGGDKNDKGSFKPFVSLIDNTGKIEWKEEPLKNMKYFVGPLFITENSWTTGEINLKGGAFKKEYDYEKSYIIYKNLRDNKETSKLSISEIMGAEIMNYSILSIGAGGTSEYDFENKEVYYTGECRDPKTYQLKGLFYVTTTLDGKPKVQKFIPFENGINKVLAPNEQVTSEDNFLIFFHKFIKTSDGKMYAIAEQYDKKQLGNMLVIEFDKEMTPIKSQSFDKAKTKHGQGGVLYGNVSTGMMLKMFGGFNYRFITTSIDQKTFNCTYVNYGDESNHTQTIGYIALTKEGKLVQDKIKIESSPTRFYVLPAKPGYTAILEYFEKKKQFTVRFEKLNL